MAKALTHEEYINSVTKLHPTIDFSKTKFINTREKVTATCSKHGDFQVKASRFREGFGCPKCAILNQKKTQPKPSEQWIAEAKEKHKNPDGSYKYDYSKTKYIHSEEYVIITCPVHGDFQQIACNHLSGSGCPKCKNLKTNFFEEAKKKAGNRFTIIEGQTYLGCKQMIHCVCPIHGPFDMRADMILFGEGCQECSNIALADKHRNTKDQFVAKANLMFKPLNIIYDYSESIYLGRQYPIDIICPIHGKFTVLAQNHLQGAGCQKCSNHGTSIAEKEIVEFIRSNYSGIIVENNRKILDGRELDIYLPELKLAFEYHGLYWHSEVSVERDYHLQKTIDCEAVGIHLIQIFEDDWSEKQSIVKSRILQLLHKTETKIYARKTEIKIVPASIEKDFLITNHLQEYIPSMVCYGLYSNGELQCLMSFGSLRKNLGTNQLSGYFELYRYCSLKNTTVIGGASKLFKHFVSNYKPIQIISYANKFWSTDNKNNLYVRLGFEFEKNTIPNYSYIIGNLRTKRYSMRKDILVSKYGCPQETTEHSFCFSNGWYRIYDSGNIKYVWNFKM